MKAEFSAPPVDAETVASIAAPADIAAGAPLASNPGKPLDAAIGEKPDATPTAPMAKTADTAVPDQAPRAPHAAATATTATPSGTQASDLPPPPMSLHASTSLLHAASATPPSAAHLTATIAGDAAVPLNGLAVEIATRNQAGASSFSIRLDPADLGRIDVRLDVDSKGQVTSHLTVEKPETLAMLRQDAPQLQRALNDAGLKTSDNALQFSLGDQASAQQNADRGTQRRPQQLIVHDDELVAAPAQLRGYGRLAGTRGGIDIRI